MRDREYNGPIVHDIIDLGLDDRGEYNVELSRTEVCGRGNVNDAIAILAALCTKFPEGIEIEGAKAIVSCVRDLEMALGVADELADAVDAVETYHGNDPDESLRRVRYAYSVQGRYKALREALG